eukprot:jgi/Chrzof1/11038/Cz05g21100.t1
MLQGSFDSSNDGTKLPSQDVLLAALHKVRSSSLNCYAWEALPDDSFEARATLFTQQFELSDPCTFRIILKTITDLEPAGLKAEATNKMDNLVLSYQKLDTYLEMAREGNPEALPKARQQLKATLQTAADIEVFVKNVLGV